MHTLYTDVPWTKKMRLFYILDETQTLVWSGSTFRGALGQLVDLGLTACIVDIGECKYEMTFQQRLQ